MVKEKHKRRCGPLPCSDWLDNYFIIIIWHIASVRAKRPVRLPTVLSREQIREFFKHITGPAAFIARIQYGTGMRLMETLTLRTKDINFDRHQILVRYGKGGKDRMVPLPKRVVEPLRDQLRQRWRQHQADLAAGRGLSACPARSGIKSRLKRKTGLGSTSSPAVCSAVIPAMVGSNAITSMIPIFKSSFVPLSGLQGFARPRAPTPYDIAARLICWSEAWTCGPFKNSWDTATSERR